MLNKEKPPGVEHRGFLVCHLPFVTFMLLSWTLWAQENGYNGKRLYEGACSPCHGIRGDGEGPAAKYLSPRPTDFSAGTFKFKTTPSGSLPADEDLTKIIRDGVRRTSMPGWNGVLRDDDISDVIAYIKTFFAGFDDMTHPQTIDIPEEIPPATTVSVQEGKMVYLVLECWNCHGPRGEGDGPSTAGLRDDRQNKTVPPNLRRDLFKGGSKPHDVYRTLSTGMTGTPMPAYDDDLFGFAREDFDEQYSALREIRLGKLYSQREIEEFSRWLGDLITREDLDSKSTEDMHTYFRQRKWALIHYISSLRRPENLPFRLLIKDYELTQ